MDLRVVDIAYHYGYESQSRQLFEEMAELIQAVNKLWRAGYTGGFPPVNTQEYKDVIEELADVQIMLFQMECLLGCDVATIKTNIDKKLDRQMERMEAERTKNG